MLLLVFLGGDCDDDNDKKPEPARPIAGGTFDDGCLINGWQLSTEKGCYHERGSDDWGTDNWGTDTLLDVIDHVGWSWYSRHPEGPRIGILDLSLEFGGHFPPHRSHQNGIDVDVRYVRKDFYEGPITIYQKSYDRNKSAELMELFLDKGACVIYSSDLELCRQIDGVSYIPDTHENHFHVRIPRPNPYTPCN